jgi:ribose transport system substrate-binding protein
VDKEHKRKNSKALFLIILSAVITAVIAMVLIHYLPSATDSKETENKYDRYYAMITEGDSSLWKSIYEGARDRAIKDNVYVDWLNDYMDSSYSVEDMMRVAISSSVDGIIVNASESDSLTELIDEAADADIPVVTLYTDHTQSKRCSFVGIGSYNLGKEYGRKVLEIMKNKETEEGTSEKYSTVNVMVLVSSYAQSLDQNILSAGIQETIELEKEDGMEVEFELKSIDDTNTFSAEEAIRDIFLHDTLPDIMICLNEQNTTCAYSAIVDYNRVGQTSILGYYDSDTILNAIERGVIDATVSVNTDQMGGYCIDALEEYHSMGNTSEYFTADITMIDEGNVADYLKEDGDEES